MAQAPVKSSVYLRFLNLVQALRGVPSFPSLDATEERLLQRLAAAWGAGRQVTVVEAMHLAADTSPTTAHRRLKSLRQKGVIDLTVDPIDNRIKYVSPTALATEHFAQLSQCLISAAREK